MVPGMLLRGIGGLLLGLAILVLGICLAITTSSGWAFVMSICAVILVLTGSFRIVAGALLKWLNSHENQASKGAGAVNRAEFDAKIQQRLNALNGRGATSGSNPVNFGRKASLDTPAKPVFPSPDAFGFEELRAQHVRPALAFYRPYPPRERSILRSHVGGLPDLPTTLKWPRAFDDGGCIPANAPLHFLAQVDLAEQPWLPEHFPARGTLFFFGALPDGYYWGTPNDARVLYDFDSCGSATIPPEDLEPINGDYGDFQRLFGDTDWLRCRTFPEWPLIGKRIDTMPDGDAFAVNSWHAEKYSGYHEALNDFRAAQIAEAAGLDLAEVAQLKPPSIGPIIDEPGFPWTPRYIALSCHMMLARGAPEVDSRYGDWLEWANSRHIGEAIEPAKAQEYKAFLFEMGMGQAIASTKNEVLMQLVRETGANAGLAQCLPDFAYGLAEKEHRPVVTGLGKGNRRDGKMHWDVRHHQMGGHVPSTQSPMALDFDHVCLMQLQSDWGTSMILCDLGEADYWIRPADLTGQRLAEAFGDTRGG